MITYSRTSPLQNKWFGIQVFTLWELSSKLVFLDFDQIYSQVREFFRLQFSLFYSLPQKRKKRMQCNKYRESYFLFVLGLWGKKCAEGCWTKNMVNIFQFSMLGNPAHVVSYAVQTQKICVEQAIFKSVLCEEPSTFQEFLKVG